MVDVFVCLRIAVLKCRAQQCVQCWPSAPEGDGISNVIGWHD